MDAVTYTNVIYFMIIVPKSKLERMLFWSKEMYQIAIQTQRTNQKS